MRILKAGLGLFTLSLIISTPTFGCDANHGYTKTATLLMQSNLSEERKTALIQVISDSKSYHDLHTREGNKAKMLNAIKSLVSVRRELE